MSQVKQGSVKRGKRYYQYEIEIVKLLPYAIFQKVRVIGLEIAMIILFYINSQDKLQVSEKCTPKCLLG